MDRKKKRKKGSTKMNLIVITLGIVFGIYITHQWILPNERIRRWTYGGKDPLISSLVYGILIVAGVIICLNQ